MPGTEGTPVYGATWGKPIHEEVTCPSGALCLVKTVLQPIDLASEEDPGAHGSDILGKMVRDKIKEAQQVVSGKAAAKSAEPNVEDIDKTIDALSTGSGMNAFLDNLLMKYVVAPKLEWRPENPADAVAGAVYVDTVPFPDKMFLFNRAMHGMQELRRFRDEADGDLESLEHVENVPLPTEHLAESGTKLSSLLPGPGGDDVRAGAGSGTSASDRATARPENTRQPRHAATEDQSGNGPMDGDEVDRS